MSAKLRVTQRFFNSYWEHKRIRWFDSTGHFARSATRRAYSLMGRLEGKRVLEVGPGEGFDIKNLFELGARVTAVDISSKSLNLTRELCSESGLLVMDGVTLGFRDSVFDLVFSRTLLMHVDREGFLRECRRVLKPGGKAVFIEPLKYNPLLVPYRAAFSFGRFMEPDYLRPADTKAMSGIFSSVKIWYFYLISAVGGPFASIAPWSRILFAPLEWMDRALLSIFPRLRNLCWISVIECAK
ncbi:MAG: methyltransferase domain-containing protein [bacterium]